ncbi:MAG: hypothetical protein Q9187_000555 [Circinaria calcarea]
MDPQLWKTRLINELNHDFENSNDYIGGSLLSLYWQYADDAGYKDESDKVIQFFASMGFDTAVYPIPSENSHIELLSEIIHLIKSQGKPGYLVVIHYGGHGDADNDRGMDRESQAVWAAQLRGGPTVDWYEIQPHLHKCKADVLLLLDCCYSAQAARGRVREDPGKCELLAACAMKLQTPSPGPASFTTALLREMNEMLDSMNQIMTSHLAHRLAHKRANLRQTPIRDDMSLGHQGRSIRWKPFLGTDKVVSESSDAISQLKLRVAVSVDPDNQDRSLHDLVQWLKVEAPTFVREIAVDEVLLQTEQLQQITLGHDSSVSTSPLVQSFDKAQRQEILDVWQEVDSLFAEVSQIWIQMGGLNSPEKVSQLKEKILHFVQELELRNSSVIRRLEAELVTLPDDTFEDVACSSSAKVLGLNNPLRLVRLIKGPGSASNSLEINAMEIQSVYGHQGSTPEGEKTVIGTVKQMDVLVEYKPYEESPGQARKLRDAIKIQKLAQILNSEKPTEFCSLNCLHWFHDSYARHYGLVFEVPSGLSLPYATCFELLGLSYRKVRPTLGQRFRIAHDIGRAIQKWHSVGWVHEEICSRNIFIFQNTGSQAWDFSKPFLGGFQYSRRETDISDGLEVDDIEKNVYRHPSRHGVPLQRHDALHDIYAYGVLLLEIGLWQNILEHRYLQGIVKEVRNPRPELIQEALVKIAIQSLGHTMGAGYRDAVVLCLEDGFENLWDDYRTQPRLMRTFKTRVLDQVAKGLDLK